MSSISGSVNRVLIVGMTGVLRDLVQDALAGSPDIELIGAGDPRPNTVVCAGPCPEQVDALLYAYPHARVLTIEDDGRQGFMHELVPRSLYLGELSPARLLAAIRSAR